jgi:4-hydroxythreonine-4-phosphate dehydrogenase
MSRPKVVITVGDPGGIGPEILWSILQSGELQDMAEITVLGPVRTVPSIPQGIEWEDVDLPSLRFHRRPHPDNGRVSLLSLEEACRRMESRQADLLVTGPVSKEAIRRCGIPFSGHTEYLGQLFSAQPYMVFLTGSMPVALLSTHLPFRDIAASITREALEGFIRGLAQAWHRQLNCRPRFRVAGLNPHAGEGGLLGREEREAIEPAIEALIAEGIEVEGPVPADSLFLHLQNTGDTIAVALYHDQGMIPAKMMSQGHAVNCTLGLPFLRTAPDHGPAFDIAGTGTADPESLRRAVVEGLELLKKRR